MLWFSSKHFLILAHNLISTVFIFIQFKLFFSSFHQPLECFFFFFFFFLLLFGVTEITGLWIRWSGVPSWTEPTSAGRRRGGEAIWAFVPGQPLPGTRPELACLLCTHIPSCCRSPWWEWSFVLQSLFSSGLAQDPCFSAARSAMVSATLDRGWNGVGAVLNIGPRTR
jgi:hypothetical protein